MRSSFKRIGDFIQLIDERNRSLSITTLLGLSIDKVFIASVANTIGSDMANYKIIRKNQFACSLMQVRRDKKIPVALLKDIDEAIISQAYPVFEISKKDKLLPEYLMMWMSRSEFDREACFYAVGGVRGSLEWDDFCNMSLPVPPIEKQHEIVREYHTIVDRIKLNEKLNLKLEETARAIYKQWFENFEFPISKECAASIGRPDLEGKPYKSSGAPMAWNDALEKEIPESWKVKNYGDAFIFKTGKLNSNAAMKNGKYPFFTCSSETYKTNSYSFDCEALVLAGNNASAVYPFKYYKGKFEAYQRTYVITLNDLDISLFQGYFEVLKQLEGFKGSSSGTATKFLTMRILAPIQMIAPSQNVSRGFAKICSPLFCKRQLTEEVIEKLQNFKDTLLMKMTKVAATV